jgi:predicted nuclease with TOPRIM domain
MILSSIQRVSTSVPLSDDKILELEQKESDLNRKDLKLNDKEEEIEIRLKKLLREKEDYKEDIKLLDNENSLRERFKEFYEQEFSLSYLS